MAATLVHARKSQSAPYPGDPVLLAVVMLLLAFGLVMMTSASVEIASSDFGDGFHYLKKQCIFLLLGALVSLVILMIPVRLWEEWSVLFLVAAIGLLAVVLIPGIGREVNGSTRWLDLGFMTVQASEPAKLFFVIFLAGFLTARHEFVCSGWKGFMTPFVFLALPLYLLFLEPDFGAMVILTTAVFGMMFLAGVKIHQFILLALLTVGAGMALVFSSGYRMARVESFLTALSNPFHEDVVYGSGYQLAQALIAFGRGEWFGVGLGNSIQKLYFLPEAHTDFVLAIIAEELGLVAVIALLGLFYVFIWRALLIARRNEETGNFFAAYMAYGITLLFLGQILINVCVNVGLLPTKGLTLPFMSAGGSSLIICLVMTALLLKIDREHHLQGQRPSARRTTMGF